MNSDGGNLAELEEAQEQKLAHPGTRTAHN
jgi:hypothetical protein